jgi:hypothetical protein
MLARGEHTTAPRSKRSIPARLGLVGAAAAICIAPMLAASPAVADEDPATAQEYPWPDGDSSTVRTQAPVHNGGLDTPSVAIGAIGGITAAGFGLSISSTVQRRRDRALMRNVR